MFLAEAKEVHDVIKSAIGNSFPCITGSSVEIKYEEHIIAIYTVFVDENEYLADVLKNGFDLEDILNELSKSSPYMLPDFIIKFDVPVHWFTSKEVMRLAICC